MTGQVDLRDNLFVTARLLHCVRNDKTGRRQDASQSLLRRQPLLPGTAMMHREGAHLVAMTKRDCHLFCRINCCELVSYLPENLESHYNLN
jgi:hypothetical protein